MIVDNEEIFFVDYEGDKSKVIMYAPLRSYLALISDDTAKSIQSDSNNDVKRSVISKVKNRHLINMRALLEEVRNQTPNLSIPITDNCNLRCRYCHASAGEEHKTKAMSKEMIRAILNTYYFGLKKNVRYAKIHFFGGGEPTFEFDKFKFAMETSDQICKERRITCHYYIATNGCYGDSVRSLIVSKFKEASLSFDGPAHIQNLHRPFASGKSSFDAVFETAKYFYAHKFPFGIRSTISSYSMDFLHQIIDFFSSNFPGIKLSLEPITPAGRSYKNSELHVDLEKFGYVIVDAFKYASDKPIKLSNAAASEFEIIKPVFCSSIGVPHLTIGTSGSVTCCSRDRLPGEFEIGVFDESKGVITLDQKKVEATKRFNVFNFEECADCFVKYHCAGDCPDRRISKNTDCNYVRKLGQYMLNNKINQASQIERR
jgi:uncharacterized protein